MVDLLEILDKPTLDREIQRHESSNPPPFGEPFIAIRITPQQEIQLDDARALHSRIVVNYMGKIKKRGT